MDRALPPCSLPGCPLDASYAAGEPQWVDGVLLENLCPQHLHALPPEPIIAGKFVTIQRCKVCGGPGRYRASESRTPEEIAREERPAIDFFACSMDHLNIAARAVPEGRQCRAVRWIPACDLDGCYEDAECRVIEVDAHYQGRVGVRKCACMPHREAIALQMLRKGLSAKFFELHPPRKEF